MQPPGLPHPPSEYANLSHLVIKIPAAPAPSVRVEFALDISALVIQLALLALAELNANPYIRLFNILNTIILQPTQTTRYAPLGVCAVDII